MCVLRDRDRHPVREAASTITVYDHGPGLSGAGKTRALQRFWRGNSPINFAVTVIGSEAGLPWLTKRCTVRIESDGYAQRC